jgi:beta-glucosidase
LDRGLVGIGQIDAAVRRVLLLKERLGLFEDPYARCRTVESPETLARRRALARSVGARAMLLLKNSGVLPLATPRRLALLGPLADAAAEMRGPWWAAGVAENHVSVLAGFRAALPQAQVLHAAGVGIEDAATDGIAAAVGLVDQADAVVLCLGEAAVMSGEAASRVQPVLPGRQLQLAEAVLARARAQGRAAVVVLFCGRPLVIPELLELTDALLVAWFPGCEAGNAVADVVLGRISPAGRTPMCWPRAVGQIPIFYGQRSSGRPTDPQDHFTSKYLDAPNEPLFPFGHGLSYGRFRLSNLQVQPAVVRPDDSLEVSVEVLNEGTHAAEETVFLFIHDTVASVSRPLLELKGFTKLRLAPGERAVARLSLRAAELAFLGPDLLPRLESGAVEVLVGPCADRARLLVAAVEVAA